MQMVSLSVLGFQLSNQFYPEPFVLTDTPPTRGLCPHRPLHLPVKFPVCEDTDQGLSYIILAQSIQIVSIRPQAPKYHFQQILIYRLF